MEINSLTQINLNAANLGATQSQLNREGIEKPEVLFESILFDLLTQAVEMNNSENSGLLGSNGPWKDLVYMVLKDNFANGQAGEIGRMLADSTYNNKLGE